MPDGERSDNAPVHGLRGHFVHDLTGLPLLRLQCPDVAHYPAVDVPSFFVGVDQALELEQSFAAILDARGLPPIGLDGRIEFVGMVNTRRARLRSHVAAFAAVVSSPFERGLVTAFAWFANPPFPVRLFSATDEAEVWLRQRLVAFENERGGGL